MNTSEKRKTFTQELKGTVSEIISQIRKLIREGNARKLMIVDKKGKILFQTQLTAGIAGTALVTAMAPIVSAISMFALFMNDIKIVVEKYADAEGEGDEYEVDAEVVVDIEEEDEEEEEGEKPSSKKSSKSKKEKKTDKTVGKDNDDSEQ